MIYANTSMINIAWGIAGSSDRYYVNPDAAEDTKLQPEGGHPLPIAKQDTILPLRAGTHTMLVYGFPKENITVLVEFFGKDIQILCLDSKAPTLVEFDVSSYHKRGVAALSGLRLSDGTVALPQRGPNTILVNPTIREAVMSFDMALIMSPPVGNALFSCASPRMHDDGVLRYMPNFAEVLGGK